MGTSIFTFRLGLDWSETVEPREWVTQAGSGKERVRSLDSTARYVGAGSVILDGTTDHAYSDWLDFYEDTAAFSTNSFLFKAVRAKHSKVDGESLGTASGGAGEDFYLDCKFIDANSLKIYVAGVEQPAADFTLTDNYSAPYIATGAGFDAGAVTADYDYYHQVRFGPGTFPTNILTRDASLTDQGAHSVAIVVREVTPGGYLA